MVFVFMAPAMLGLLVYWWTDLFALQCSERKVLMAIYQIHEVHHCKSIVIFFSGFSPFEKVNLGSTTYLVAESSY